jgi:methylphosphotriester-DNA--protein-cysteine methyltransferase
MQNELVLKVAALMNEQSSAYARLESATAQLTAALVRGEPNSVDSLSRAGESELTKMRARLLEITSQLASFAELRAAQTERTPLEAATREQFDAAAQSLLEAARKFKLTAVQAATLANGGSSFANACIQMCGVPPTTYSKPVLKYAEVTRS